jgi:hypothetical protein
MRGFPVGRLVMDEARLPAGFSIVRNAISAKLDGMR